MAKGGGRGSRREPRAGTGSVQQRWHAQEKAQGVQKGLQINARTSPHLKHGVLSGSRSRTLVWTWRTQAWRTPGRLLRLLASDQRNAQLGENIKQKQSIFILLNYSAVGLL